MEGDISTGHQRVMAGKRSKQESQAGSGVLARRPSPPESRLRCRGKMACFPQDSPFFSTPFTSGDFCNSAFSILATDSKHFWFLKKKMSMSGPYPRPVKSEFLGYDLGKLRCKCMSECQPLSFFFLFCYISLEIIHFKNYLLVVTLYLYHAS